MSIKKEFGMNLLEGKAKWEYRRRKSKITTGDKIILYATSPHKKFIGEFIVGRILTGTPKELWEATKRDICYEIQEVVPYLSSGDYPIAFEVTESRKYNPSMPIFSFPDFKAPMSYCKAPESVISGVCCN